MAVITNLTFEEKPVRACPMGFYKRPNFRTKQLEKRFQRPRYFQEIAQFTISDDFTVESFTVEKHVEANGETKYWITSPNRFSDNSRIANIYGLGSSMHDAWADFRFRWHLYGKPFGKSYMWAIVGHCGNYPIIGKVDRYVYFE